MTAALKKALDAKKPKVSATIQRDLLYTPTQVMAKLAGCSVSHLSRLVKKGEIKQVAGMQGKYDAYEVLKYFRESEEIITPMQKAKLEEVLEKTRKDKLHNDEKDGLLVPVNRVAEFTHAYAGHFVRIYEGLRKKAGAMVGTQMRIKIDDEFRKGREELSVELEAFRDSYSRASGTASEAEPS